MTDTVTMRRGCVRDAALIRAVTRAAYEAWVPLLGREPLSMLADYDEALRHHRFDLLEDAGTVAALVETAAHPDHLLVVNVAVVPTFQGRGLGRRLLAHAEGIARSAGLGEMRLFTNKLFARNIRLYTDFGDRIDREEPFMGGRTVYMSKMR